MLTVLEHSIYMFDHQNIVNLAFPRKKGFFGGKGDMVATPTETFYPR